MANSRVFAKDSSLRASIAAVGGPRSIAPGFQPGGPKRDPNGARVSGRQSPVPAVESFSMDVRGYHVDTVHRTITSQDGRVVRIEPKAFDLLLYFTQHPEETLSREQLIA